VGISKITNYFKLVKFSHTIFAMPFALIGFFMAVKYFNLEFNYYILLYVILDMIFARNAAMGFNRYVDKNIDSKNPRTANREIPKGIISPKNAIFFVIINSILFIVTTYFINKLTFYLSPVAIFTVLFYSYTKRFTWFSHIILGIGLGLAPIGAFLAVSGYFNILPVLLSFAVVFWVSGFDVMYALQDYEFDKTNGLKSIPVFLGKRGALNLSIFLHFISIGLIFIFGVLSGLGILFWIGSIIFFVILIYQHFLVKPNDLSRINLAFFTTNGVASVIFAIFTITDFYWQFNLIYS